RSAGRWWPPGAPRCRSSAPATAVGATLATDRRPRARSISRPRCMSAYPSMPGHPERVWGTASLRIAIRYSFDDLQPVHHIARDHKSSSRVLRGHQITIKGLVNELYLDDLRDKTHRGLTGRALKGL